MFCGLVAAFVMLYGIFDTVSSKSIQNGTLLETEMEAMKKSLKVFETKLNNMTVLMKNLMTNPIQEEKYPYFYVELSSNTALNTNSIVKFNMKLVDEGDNFNTGDGIFVSPISGLYMFSWTIQMHTSKNTHTELRVDNIVKGREDTTGQTGYFATTRVVLCNVNKGDHVWIQTGGHYTENYFHVHYDAKSSFTGVLLRKK